MYISVCVFVSTVFPAVLGIVSSMFAAVMNNTHGDFEHLSGNYQPSYIALS